jgi:hypothetical protein
MMCLQKPVWKNQQVANIKDKQALNEAADYLSVDCIGRGKYRGNKPQEAS